MLCSLNEIEAQLRKAARGAGLPWGIAEEAGKAGRWLTMYGVTCLPVFAALFELNEARPFSELAVMDVAGCWRASDGALCPLLVGAALVDRAAEIAGGRTVELAAIACPILLAPFAAAVAGATGSAIALDWPGERFAFTDGGVWRAAGADTTMTGTASQARCGRLVGAAPGIVVKPRIGGVAVAQSAWSRLDVFVQRTYVPASDESRLRGAGTGLLDID